MFPAAPWQTLFPFQSRHIRLGAHRYHYVDEGSGDVLLLVHGNPTWSFYWRELIRAWSPRYRRMAPSPDSLALQIKPGDG